ncbi:MAG: tripartite tricarboxylate transporter substrate binding protein [Betaproteobacteria bacterium]|nr:tripartite tricarboxylate transporter substrate binding protein [Betaproteobacteria bacterium]
MARLAHGWVTKKYSAIYIKNILKTNTCVFFLFCACTQAWAQTYPARPIRFIVPFSPGGSIDLLARLVGKKMEETLGVPLVVDNRSGAGGVLGVKLTADARPDGYTIAIVSPGPMTIAAALDPKLPYDLRRHFTYVSALASYVGTLLVSQQINVKSVGELIEYAKKNPGKVTFASSGVGSSVHIMAELFLLAAGIDNAVHVPYKGGGELIQAVMGGHVLLGSTSLAAAGQLINAGKVKALVVFDRERYTTFPVVPAATEELPQFDPPLIWYGVIGPAGMPPEAVAKLNRAANAAMDTPELRAELVKGAYKVIGGTPRAFQSLVEKDAKVLGDVVRAARITLEK